MARRIGPLRLSTLIGLVVAVVLVIAMIASTKFLTPEELAAAQPKKFDPAETAGELWKKAQAELPGKAKPAAEVIVATQKDPKAAAAKYGGISPAEDAYVFPVTATGQVTDATADSLRLKIPGVPSATTVLVPLTTAINGTAVRDATGFKFADAPGQTDYQYVGDELKKLMQAQVKTDLPDPASAKGKTVTVTGVIAVLAPGNAPPPAAKPVNIQPLSIKVG